MIKIKKYIIFYSNNNIYIFLLAKAAEEAARRRQIPYPFTISSIDIETRFLLKALQITCLRKKVACIVWFVQFGLKLAMPESNPSPIVRKTHNSSCTDLTDCNIAIDPECGKLDDLS